MEFLSGTSFLYQYVLSVCRASEVVLVVKNLPANVRDIKNAGSISGLERSPEGCKDSSISANQSM